MIIELFGRNFCGEVEFLGTFGREEHVLRAIDEFDGMGYKRIVYYTIEK